MITMMTSISIEPESNVRGVATLPGKAASVPLPWWRETAHVLVLSARFVSCGVPWSERHALGRTSEHCLATSTREHRS